MASEPGRGWWMLILRGICAVLFGILAFIWPGITLFSLVLLFGAYALTNGILAIVMAAKAPRGSSGKVLTVILGLISIGAAVVTVLYPGITALSLVFIIGGWAIVSGSFEIAAAVALRKRMSGTWMLVLSGVLSVIFGVLLFLMPAVGALSLVWLIGSYALVFGVLLLVSAIRLKNALAGIPQPATV
jgi:uncharacterized membrane protein HdeD (DUF308 family)